MPSHCVGLLESPGNEKIQNKGRIYKTDLGRTTHGFVAAHFVDRPVHTTHVVRCSKFSLPFKPLVSLRGKVANECENSYLLHAAGEAVGRHQERGGTEAEGDSTRDEVSRRLKSR
jgi:hypothetical protein